MILHVLMAACLGLSPADEPRILEVYDVSDLTQKPDVVSDEQEPLQGRTAARLLSALLGKVAEAQDPEAESRGTAGAWALRATAASHECVQQCLATLRSPDRTLIQIDTRVVRIGDPGLSLLRDLETDLEEKFQALDISRERGQELLTAMEEDGRYDTLTAPRVTVFPLQTWSVSATSEIHYVKGYEHVELEDGTKVVDPVIDTAQDGVIFGGRAVAGAVGDGDLFALQFFLRVSDIERPLAVMTTPDGPVQHPMESTCVADGDLTVAAGRCLLMLSRCQPPPGDGDYRLAVFVSLRAASPTPAGDR